MFSCVFTTWSSVWKGLRVRGGLVLTVNGAVREEFVVEFRSCGVDEQQEDCLL